MAQAAVGDEVWDAEESSLDSDGTDVDSDVEHDRDALTAASQMRQGQCRSAGKDVPCAERRACAATPAKVGGASIGYPERKPVVASRSCPEHKPFNAGIGYPERKPVARVQKPVAAAAKAPSESGLMGLVSHLRGDNARLREALLQAQAELEALAAHQATQDAPVSIDFAHLLALVKDFEEDDDVCGRRGDGSDDETQKSRGLEVFAMNSPRTSEEDVEETLPSAEGDVALLKKELEEARTEVMALRAKLALKEDEDEECEEV